jgi:regulator of protease activity HflC (stomatin/prohibitin superfamily)
MSREVHVFFFWVMAVTAVFAGLAGLTWVFTRSKDAAEQRSRSRGYDDEIPVSTVAGWAAVVLTTIAIISLLISSITMVGTKQVGVVTSFGKPVGTMSNGLHFKAPWQKVTEFDGALQPDKFLKPKDAKGFEGCIEVRTKSNSNACVDVTVTWRIVPGAADDLYRDYRDFDKVRENLVNRQLNVAVTQAFLEFDPLNAVSADGQINPAQSLKTFEQKVTAALKNQVGAQIQIVSLTLPLIHFDRATQDRLDRYQAEIGNTRVAQQKQKTAEAEAKANEIISKSLRENGQGALISKCLDIWAKTGGTVPPYCFPGGNSGPIVSVK